MFTGETFFAINRQLCYESIAIHGEVVNSGKTGTHKTNHTTPVIHPCHARICDLLSDPSQVTAQPRPAFDSLRMQLLAPLCRRVAQRADFFAQAQHFSTDETT